MPNQVHCILDFERSSFVMERSNQFGKLVANSVSMVINRNKGVVKHWCKKNNYSEFEWQGRFCDHVIRNNNEFRTIKNYIFNNPRYWDRDKLHL